MSDRYVRGASSARSHARLETKPTCGPSDTGGGYEHVRTREYDDSDPREGRIDVYVSHHRLLAVAWNVTHSVDGEPLFDDELTGVVDMTALDGIDIHHNAPEADADRGVPWDNREATLSWVGHAEHSGLTNAAKRAYAEDAKRVRDGEVSLESAATCAECDAEIAAAVAGERYCLDHATAAAKRTGETVKVL